MDVSEEVVAEIERLNLEIFELTKTDPALRTQYQAIEGAFVVAELLDAVRRWSQKSLADLQAESGIDPDTLAAALGASCDTPTTLRTLLLLSAAAGFRAQIQLLPVGTRTENSLLFDEPGTGIAGELISFPHPFDETNTHLLMQIGFARAAHFAGHPQHYVNLEQLTPDMPVWELFRITEGLGLKLLFRVAPVESMSHSDTNQYLQSAIAVEITTTGMSSSAQELPMAGASVQRDRVPFIAAGE